jgi:hypothetical protein
MKITEDVRRYAAEKGLNEEEAIERGLNEKSREFVEKGADVYSKAYLRRNRSAWDDARWTGSPKGEDARAAESISGGRR